MYGTSLIMQETRLSNLCKVFTVHAMKAYAGGVVWIYLFLTPTLDGGPWSYSRPD